MKNPYALCIIIAGLQVFILYLVSLILRERRRSAELRKLHRIAPVQIKAFDPEAGGEK